MRPRGDIRNALSRSAWELARQRAEGVTWRELAMHSQVGFKAARKTVFNMADAGELVAVGRVRMVGVCRPLTTYLPAPVEGPTPATQRTADLTNAINGWARI